MWEVRDVIKFKRAHGEKASANSNDADKWNLTKLFPEDLYNSNETRLYYCVIPDGSMRFKHKSIAKSKNPWTK